MPSSMDEPSLWIIYSNGGQTVARHHKFCGFCIEFLLIGSFNSFNFFFYEFQDLSI